MSVEPVYMMGIDPSLSATGWWTPVAHGTIKTAARDPRRDYHIQEAIQQVLDAHPPRHVCIESLPANAMSAGLTGRAQGIIRAELQHREIPFLELPPATVKKFFTGSGKADKGAMMRRCDEMGLSYGDDNSADAAALAWCGVHVLNNLDILPAPKGGWRGSLEY